MIRSLFLLFFFCSLSAQAQVQWMSFSQLDSLQEIESRPILVFLEADWCTYCKKMKSEAFSKSDISDLVRSQFWAVKLDIEDTSTIHFDGLEFMNDDQRKYHSLSYLFAVRGAEPITPTLVILDSDFQFQVFETKYLSRKALKNLLSRSY